MILTVIPNQYERCIIKDINEQDFTHEDLIELISKPMISDTKNTSVYIIPFIMNYTDGKSYTTKSNCELLSAIILDIDGGITIEDFKRTIHFKYYLYTTFSHKPDHHKFRVIIPIEHPLTFKSYDTKFMRYWLNSMFPMNDPKTWNYRGYYAPNCQSMHNYEWYYRDWETDRKSVV